MGRTRKKPVDQPVTETTSPATDDTEVTTDTPLETHVIMADDIVHGASTRTLDKVQYEPPVSASGGPGTVRENGHATAIERKPLPRPADPFGITTDVLAGVRLSESRRYGKMLIAFEEKPSQEVIGKLRDAHFRWEPAEKVWTLGLGERPMASRITAEETFNEVSKMIREERGITHSVGVAAS